MSIEFDDDIVMGDDPYDNLINEDQDDIYQDDDEENVNPDFFEDQMYNSENEEMPKTGEELVVGSNSSDMDLKKLLTIVFKDNARQSKKSGNAVKRLVGEIIGNEGGDIEEEEIAPWEFIYDENYDPDLDKLMKDKKTREYQRRKVKSNKQLMREVNEEWEMSSQIVKSFINYHQDKLGISKNTINNTLIDTIFSSCPELVKITQSKPPVFINDGLDIPYNWINTWKKDVSHGGKGITVMGKMFSGVNGIIEYRDRIIQAIHENKNPEFIQSQINEIEAGDILPPNDKSVNVLIDSQKESTVETQLFKQIGQVVVKPSISTMDDLTDMINNLKVSDSDYSLDNLTFDLQDKLKVSMESHEKKQFKENVRRLAKTKDTLFLKDLFYTKENKIIVNRKITHEKEVDRLTVFMENMTLKSSINKLRDQDTNPYAIGVKKEGKVISSNYSSDITFIKPYKDPHFTFLNEVVETWVPTVHYVTGLPVFSNKEEILSYKLSGKIVYIKLQEVSVNISKGKNVKVLYFRKFVDFLDYLKSWQETYVKKVTEIGLELGDIVDKSKNFNIKDLSILISRRNNMLKRIKDIKMYFVDQS